MPKVKKPSLTQEELVAQAIVPEGEQPYDVPSNWVWTPSSAGDDHIENRW